MELNIAGPVIYFRLTVRYLWKTVVSVDTELVNRLNKVIEEQTEAKQTSLPGDNHHP